MKLPFHYLVKARVITIKNNEPVFEEIEKIFENENPIIAREKAFRFYQNWIDVLLESKNQEYVSDKETRRELQSFIQKDKKIKLNTDVNIIEFSLDSLGNGIGVYLVVDKIADAGNWSCTVDAGAELLIHGIGNIFEKYMSEKYLIDRLVISLSTELEYYQHYNYNTLNQEKEITYCMWMIYHDGDINIDQYKILETPFDWKGYDKPFWWGKQEIIELDEQTEDVLIIQEPAIIYEQKEVEPEKKSFQNIIAEGECNTVEFKSTLLYNFKTKKGGIGIKEIIAKAICGFLNSNGGLLFIGVKDDKSVQGLTYDFSLAEGKDVKDFFLLEYDQMLSHFFGNSIRSNISANFHFVEGKEIFVVEVFPNKRKPVFLKGQFEKIFYVRGEASTNPIKDPEEIVNYFLNRHYKN